MQVIHSTFKRHKWILLGSGLQIELALGCKKHASEVQFVGLQLSDYGGKAISVSKLISYFFLYIFWVLGVKYFPFFFLCFPDSLQISIRVCICNVAISELLSFFFFFLSSEWWIFWPRSVPICISCRESYYLKLKTIFISSYAYDAISTGNVKITCCVLAAT